MLLITILLPSFWREKPAIKKEAAKLLAAKNDRIREALAADEGEEDEEE